MKAEMVAYDPLIADTTVFGIVGSKVYPDFVPAEKTLPAVAITRTNTEPLKTIHSNVALAYNVTLEIWCLHSSRALAETLGDAVEIALAPAGFVLENRVPEFDAEAVVWATVLTVKFWQQ